MWRPFVRNLRSIVLGLVLAGGAVFSAPATGCGPLSAKDVSAEAARLTGYNTWRTNFGQGG